MQLKLTPGIRQLLQEVASDEGSPQDLREATADVGASGKVDWEMLKAAAQFVRQQKGADAVPSMDQLCRGSALAFPQPRKREGKPPQLQRRLDELRAKLEQAQYDAMVADVTQGERAAAAAREGGLSTYRQQISFGVHVLAMMAAFYIFGHLLGMAATSNKALHPMVGLVFMAIAMLLETVLFIIRTTVPPKLHQEAARRAVAARVARQQERHKQEAAAEAAAGSGGAGEAAGEGEIAVEQQCGGLEELPMGRQKSTGDKKED